jgi:hypothetical protein
MDSDTQLVFLLAHAGLAVWTYRTARSTEGLTSQINYIATAANVAVALMFGMRILFGV